MWVPGNQPVARSRPLILNPRNHSSILNDQLLFEMQYPGFWHSYTFLFPFRLLLSPNICVKSWLSSWDLEADLNTTLAPHLHQVQTHPPLSPHLLPSSPRDIVLTVIQGGNLAVILASITLYYHLSCLIGVGSIFKLSSSLLTSVSLPLP